jgi:hypothetical protein
MMLEASCCNKYGQSFPKIVVKISNKRLKFVTEGNWVKCLEQGNPGPKT